MADSTFTRWIPAYPGHLSEGDTVRVLHTAFSSEAGQKIHNGRVGVVVRVANGDIVVRSTDDRSPLLREARYPYYKLEKAV